MSRVEKHNPLKRSTLDSKREASKNESSHRGSVIRELTYDNIKEDAIQFGLATDVLFQINAGKEASIYLAMWKDFPIILKAYRIYQSSHKISQKSGYMQSGTGKRTRCVLSMMEDLAVREFDLLEKCFRAGMRVPTPIGRVGNYLTMRFIGDGNRPAPQLKDVELEHPETVLDQILDDYLIMYSKVNYVHGDLSEYNILWWKGGPWIIDIPQAEKVDTVCDMKQMESLLRRDIEHLLSHFEQYDIYRDADYIVRVFLKAYIPENQRHYDELVPGTYLL